MGECGREQGRIVEMRDADEQVSKWVRKGGRRGRTAKSVSGSVSVTESE